MVFIIEFKVRDQRFCVNFDDHSKSQIFYNGILNKSYTQDVQVKQLDICEDPYAELNALAEIYE